MNRDDPYTALYRSDRTRHPRVWQDLALAGAYVLLYDRRDADRCRGESEAPRAVDEETFNRLLELGVIESPSGFPLYTFPLVEERSGQSGQQTGAVLTRWHREGKHTEPDPRCPLCRDASPEEPEVRLGYAEPAAQIRPDADVYPLTEDRTKTEPNLDRPDRPEPASGRTVEESVEVIGSVIGSLSGRPPRGRERDWVARMVRDHGEERVVHEARAAWAVKPDRHGFLDRLADRLIHPPPGRREPEPRPPTAEEVAAGSAARAELAHRFGRPQPVGALLASALPTGGPEPES